LDLIRTTAKKNKFIAASFFLDTLSISYGVKHCASEILDLNDDRSTADLRARRGGRPVSAHFYGREWCRPTAGSVAAPGDRRFAKVELSICKVDQI
jgi:hypothetical protein